MSNKLVLSFLTLIVCLPGRILGHAGNLDLNGGHYWGQSYHCHVTACEMPDTFDFRRRARDSLLTDYRQREKFFNEDDWTYEEDFDGDCQSTRQEILVLTSRVDVRYTNPRNCVVRTGEWLDEYTGELFKVAVKLEVDHIILECMLTPMVEIAGHRKKSLRLPMILSTSCLLKEEKLDASEIEGRVGIFLEPNFNVST